MLVRRRTEESELEREEFERLVSEMEPLGFTRSAEVSRYIRDNKLGKRYPHISGCLTMSMKGREWSFDGGISQSWYAALCRRFGLDGRYSGARVERFVSYSTMRAD